MTRPNPLPPRISQAEVMRLIAEGSGSWDDDTLMEYLDEIADSYTADEALAVITLVDTPDVFD